MNYSLPNGQTIQYYLGPNFSQDRWATMLVATVGVLDLKSVTITERQRHIVMRDTPNCTNTSDSMIFLIPTTSSCPNTSNYQFYLGHNYWSMPYVNSSECPQLAQILPGVSSIPGYFYVTAAICHYHSSIQNYDGSVINGKLVEQTVDDPIPLELRDSESWTFVSPVDLQEWDSYCDFMCGFANPCIVENIVYKNTSANLTDVPGGLAILDNVKGHHRCLYGLAERWVDMFSNSTLSNIILGTKYLTNEQPEICAGLSNSTEMVCPRTWWLSGIYNGGNASAASINAFMKRGFNSLTSQLRTTGVDWDVNPAVATGTSHETAVCIQFRWEWLLYPLVVVAGTLILLLAIASSSGLLGHNREVIWKTSVLPILLYGLEDGERKGGTELEPEGALKESANPMRVRFTSGDGGWRLHSS